MPSGDEVGSPHAPIGSDEGLVDPSPRRLAPDLPEVGPLALGCWRMTEPAMARDSLEAAIEAGMNLVDTADVYGLDWGGSGFGTNEAALGAALSSAPGLRDRIVLATKGGIVPGVPYDSSRPTLRAACEASLRRLRTDVIDLYQVHRPDLFTHPAELAATLGELLDLGLVRTIGVSNMTVAQIDTLSDALDSPISTNQVELSVAALGPVRDGTLDRCLRVDTTLLAWSPLAGGRVISGEGLRPALIAELDRIAEREQVDRVAVALAFVLALPGRPVAIIGTQRPERIGAATTALGVHLSRGDAYRLIEASEGIPLP
jgi:predicted oxidoreductase